MTFTQCRHEGVVAMGTKGRLINCVITQCETSGIFSGRNALIELEGDQTKVDGNGTSEYSFGYGLETEATSSTIHLLSPLTKESVSTNNYNGQNYGSLFGGTIETVDALKVYENRRRHQEQLKREREEERKEEENTKMTVTRVRLTLFVLFVAWLPRMAWYEWTEDHMPMHWTELLVFVLLVFVFLQ